MNQFIDENCNSSFSNSFLEMNQFICLSQINPNELNANFFMKGMGHALINTFIFDIFIQYFAIGLFCFVLCT